MSQPTTTTTTTKIPKLYSTKAKVYDCIVFFLFITVSFILVVSVPVITRGVIFLQPESPQFNVSSSSLTILNVSSNAITANFNVTFSTKKKPK
uniref:Late embryogenesis abundant protein LEA-2 subgroup domain-containing protein n=1 Tax=Populus trichocarpa TaxID=3694 RepID=A0A3N7EDH7_POPTR